MKVFTSTLLVKRAFRTSTFTALCLGLLSTAPLHAQRQAADGPAWEPEPQARATVIANAAEPDRAQLLEDIRRVYGGASAKPPARGALLTGTELLTDGGFEADPTPAYGSHANNGSSGYSGPWYWQTTSTYSILWHDLPGDSYPAARTGTVSVYFQPFLGSGGSGGISNVFQPVTIPRGTATLSFWLSVITFNRYTASADRVTVYIVNASNTASLATLGSYSNTSDAAGSYVQHTFDVSAFAGQTVGIGFQANINNDSNTVFLLDDVSLTSVPASSGSCVEDSLTMCLVNGRYKVTSHWKNQYATPVTTANLSKAKLTDNEGAFWNVDASTHEYLIRFNTVTDNGRVWIAIPTFTDVEFWIAVTDTVNGQSKEYHSAPGNKTLIYDPFFFVYP